MKRKSVLTTMLACALLASCLIACANENTASTAESTANGSSAADTSGEGGDSGEIVKLTALFNKHSLTKDVNEMQWLTDLEADCNVDVEWQQISADWDQKKSAMFASGEIPDLLFNATADSDYIQYYGLFEDLKPWIEQYAPNLQAMFEEVPETEILCTTLEGKIFGTPKYQSVWPKTNGTIFINQTWLDNVNMEIPTTWEELKEVLIAFKEQDANGNGDPNDEIPMDFNGGFNSPYGLSQFLGSTGLQLSSNYPGGYFAEDGEVKNYYIDERFKRTVKFAQELWSLGLINEEAITQDYSKFQSLARGEGTTAKVGFTWGAEGGDRFGLELADQYVSIPQLKEDSSTEKVCFSYDFYDINYGGNRIAMSANCQNKEAAMKFIDGFYDEKVSIEVLFGGMNEADGCVRDNGDGSYEVLPPADSSMDPGTWKWTNSFADNGPIYIRDGLDLKLGTDMQAMNEEKAVYDPLYENLETNDIYPQLFMKYNETDTNTLAMNQANIDNLTDQTWSAWVTDSSRDIDAEWDAYVQSVLDSGLSQNLEIRQAAYDTYLETMA